MHERLWAGVQVKLEHAEFFLEQMGASLVPPRDQHSVATEASGAIIDPRWQKSFSANLDAFLVMVWSVPEIIQACFGYDSNSKMAKWFNALHATEQTRRKQFSGQFEVEYKNFRNLPETTARNIAVHRSGVAPVEVSITGRFGVTYAGTPIDPIPVSEHQQPGGDAAQQFASALPPRVLRPTPKDFTMNGRPLFDACREYLEAARTLDRNARMLAGQIHATESLTPPPAN